jgi:hypothetical protein
MPSRAAAALERVRKLCLSWPETSERPTHGAPAFFVRDRRCFAKFVDNVHGDGRLALWCAAPPGAQAMLVESNAEVYFVPPYVGPSGWVGVWLDRQPDWAQIDDLLQDSYRLIAPKKLLALLKE